MTYQHSSGRPSLRYFDLMSNLSQTMAGHSRAALRCLSGGELLAVSTAHFPLLREGGKRDCGCRDRRDCPRIEQA